MMNKPILTGRADPIPKGLAIGSMVSILFTVLSAVIMAKMLDLGKISWERIGYGILIQTILSSYLGAKISYMRIKRQRLLISLASGGIYYGILLTTAAVFFGAQYEGMGVTALAVLAGCGCAALLCFEKNKNTKARIKKKRYC